MTLTRPDPKALAAAAIDHVRAEPQALVGDQRPAPNGSPTPSTGLELSCWGPRR